METGTHHLDEERLKLLKEHFGERCRCCLMQGPMANIFELKYDDTSFSVILDQLFSIQINTFDELPKNMCESCIIEVVRCYNFKKTFLKSEETLQAVITKEIENLVNKSVLYETEFGKEDCVNTITISDEDSLEDDTNKLLETLEEIISDEDLDEENYTEINPNDFDKLATQLNIFNVPESNIEVETVDHFTDSIVSWNDIEINPADSEENFMQSEKELLRNKTPKSKIFACICKQRFASYPEYLKHRQEQNHINPDITCKVCDKTFRRRYYLKTHMLIHSQIRPYECETCGQRFSFPNNLKRHVMIHTGEKSYICELCGKGFIQKVSLIDHTRIHTKEKPFLCMYCGRQFANSSVYRRHLMRHNKRESSGHHQCSVCQKNFKYRSVLDNHMKFHGEKNFLCSACGKTFYTNAMLQSHFTVHTEEKPYSCTICQKAFSRQMSLRVHTRIHTGHKPYICQICYRAFKQASHLKTHLQSHSSIKPYKCKYCFKGFGYSGNLTIHIRTHTGETPYVCTLCSEGFHDSKALKKHRRCHDMVTYYIENK